jgi:hypothetical protein
MHANDARPVALERWPGDKPLRHYRTMAVLLVEFLAAKHGVTTDQYFEDYNKGKHQTLGEDLISHDQLMRYAGIDPGVGALMRLLREHGEPILEHIFRMGAAEDHLFGD